MWYSEAGAPNRAGHCSDYSFHANSLNVSIVVVLCDLNWYIEENAGEKRLQDSMVAVIL